MNPKPLLCDSEELRHRAMQGDPTLVADLLACFQDDLLRFLRSRCGDNADAQDATQDTFESAIRYIDGYRGDSSLKNWLYRLASSACLKMRRGQKNDATRHKSIEDTEQIDKLLPSQQDTEAMLHSKLMPLQDALSQLQPLDRSVLLMRDGEGISTTETAQKLQLTPSAVKSRLHRARKQMREFLEEENDQGALS